MRFLVTTEQADSEEAMMTKTWSLELDENACSKVIRNSRRIKI